MDQAQMGTKCPCPHHKVIPWLVVVFGLLFLFRAMNVFTHQFVDMVWPILVIVVGLQKVFKNMCKCC